MKLDGKKNSSSHGARPVYRNYDDDSVDLDSRLSIKNSLSAQRQGGGGVAWRADSPSIAREK